MNVVDVTVIPGARKERMEALKEGMFKISVKEAAEDNKANNRVRELLALHFHIPKQRVRVLSGAHSSKKRFEIINA